MLGHALVGQDNRRIVIVPLSSARVHVVRGDSVISSSGSPMWVYDLNGTLSAYDEGGHRVSGPVPVGHQALAGNGDAEKVLVDDSTQEPGMGRPSTYHLFAPATGRTTLLPTKGCAQVPAIGGGVVVVPTGDQCEVTRTLDVFRLDGSLLRMARIPGTESLGAPPLPSPDGRYVALRLNNPDDVISDLGNLAILDMASGRWTVIRDTSTWDTAGWSSDGSVLLMHNQDVGAATTFSTLAYLRPGESRLRSLRVAAGEANFLVPN
jgi:hypothetical protein